MHLPANICEFAIHAGPGPAIVVDGLTVEFGGRAVLDHVHLSLHGGQLAALTGDNGAGKTTLLRCLAGLIRPTSGQVTWWSSRRCDSSVRRRLGLVAHQSHLYPEFSPRENLEFAARMYDVADPREQVERWLTMVGLQRWADQPTARLSHGMRRRLSIVRALLHQPEVLLLDEPFSGLDSAGQQWLAEVLCDLRDRGTAVCVTIHDRPLALRLADRVLRLECGRLQDHPNRDRTGSSGQLIPHGEAA